MYPRAQEIPGSFACVGVYRLRAGGLPTDTFELVPMWTPDRKLPRLKGGFLAQGGGVPPDWAGNDWNWRSSWFGCEADGRESGPEFNARSPLARMLGSGWSRKGLSTRRGMDKPARNQNAQPMRETLTPLRTVHDFRPASMNRTHWFEQLATANAYPPFWHVPVSSKSPSTR
jgi:hypothetical protein